MTKIRYYLAAFLAAVIWGFFAIPLRHLKAYPAEQILHYRIFSSLVITWLIISVFRKTSLKSDITYYKSAPAPVKRKLLLLTLLAGILITGNWFTFIYATNNVSLKSAAFAYMVCPLITALGGFLILKEQLSSRKFIAIGVAALSIIILAWGSAPDVSWSVFIASFYAFYLIVQRVLNNVDKLTILGVQLVISLILMLPLFLLHQRAVPVELDFWLNILLISVVFTILPLFLSLYALNGIPSSTVGIIIYINPIISFAVAFFYFHEGITTYQLCAYTLLFLAVALFNSDLIQGLIRNRMKHIG
ncbi:EamA family transporter [Rubrolithibacter danxiaensis]|uniref:EamA family transporter n=1 Tax=Rubrolithibacter danxiaensis TaxID=3390805 RepID=UPI003BF7BB57